MKLHVVSLPHTHTTADHYHCAYTQKVRKFGKMMTQQGFEVIIYSGEYNDAVCAEHVPLLTEAQRAEWYGEYSEMALHPIVWDMSLHPWITMNARAIQEISARIEKGDIICISAGLCQKLIELAFPKHLVCEPFVGYEGIATKYRAFESHTWRAHVYGLQQRRHGLAYDTVIPNYFDMDEFPTCRGGDGDYLLFLGRVTQQKGPDVAVQIANRVGQKIVIAGPGVSGMDDFVIHGDGVDIPRGGVPVGYVGPVNIEQRARLLADATAVLMPTHFVEPFGGVAVEAMLSGVPVIAPSWGAFSETIIPGVTGYHYQTLQEAADAVEVSRQLDPQEIRSSARDRYSLEAVGPQFTQWFNNLAELHAGKGWDA